MSVPVFAEMQTDKPTFEGVSDEYKSITDAFETAADDAGRIEAVRRWNDLRRGISTWGAMVGLRFNQDTRNADYKAERDYLHELAPKLQNLDNDFKRRMLNSPHRPALEAEFGAHAFKLWEFDNKAHDPSIEQEQVQISKLGSQYTELLASAKFEFKGETLNLSSLGKYLVDTDRDTRKEAHTLRAEWFDTQRPELDRLFHELTQLRHTSAKKLGLKDYIELGYLRMHRLDYSLDDIKVLRQQIVNEVVPLCAELARLQAEELGVDKAMFWDSGIYDKDGSPKPKGDHDWMVLRAQEMFDDVGHGLGDFFKLMREKDLLDLKSREGKAGGGFCTSFPVFGVPYVFANFNGTKGDVEVFTHEMGHAFQNYSARTQPLVDYLWPTYESAEIHSMSLEFITWPWMEKFFEEDADRFRRSHLLGSLMFLPYGTAVDHFQHMIYEKPDATPEERHAMWKELESVYLPWRDYGDLPHYPQGAFWQAQRHIYLSPFYYIDYVLAQLCALQFWVRVTEDRNRAMQDYVALCKRGGEAPFLDLVDSAGLQSPFKPGALSAIVGQARDWLNK
jgi:M3 family oligoendopeptidase